jgi:urea transport system substrate-binding protein
MEDLEPGTLTQSHRMPCILFAPSPRRRGIFRPSVAAAAGRADAAPAVRFAFFFLLFACVSCAAPPRHAPPPPAAPIVLEPEPEIPPEKKAEADAPDAAVVPGSASAAPAPDPDRVRVGIIHSLSGTLAHEETPLMHAALMTIDELNRAGGVLGRQLDPIVVDPASNWPLFAEKARELVEKEQTRVVFGGYTSVSRKAMLPVFEEFGGLHFYPAQHEGEETSSAVVYTGCVPSQSVSVVADHLFRRPGARIKNWFVIGTDYVVPRTQAKVLTTAWRTVGIPEQDVETVFTPFGHADYKELVARVRRHASNGPTAVLSLLYGDSNLAFQRELVAQRVSPKTTPIVAFGVEERDVEKQGGLYAGVLLARSYFGVLDSPRNAAFKKLSADYATARGLGSDRFTLNDDVEATYIGIHLWKQAVESAKSLAPNLVVAALAGQTFDAPSGYTVRMDPKNHHLHKPYFLAEVQRSGKVKIVWKTPVLVAPEAPAAP